MDYQIISDSSCDLTAQAAEENQVGIVPFYVSFDGQNYQKEQEEITVRDVYQRMVNNSGVFPKSSLPSLQNYMDVFTRYAEQNLGVICICITSKFSGSYQAARAARELVLESYEDAKIAVIDSTVATVLQGLLVLEATRMKRAGLSFEQTVAELERLKTTGRIFFTIGSMDYLIHGGRVGKLTGTVASTLGIKPLIVMKEGEIFPAGITYNRMNGKKKLIALIKKYLQNEKIDLSNYLLAIGYGYDSREGEEFRQMLLKELGVLSKQEVGVHQIGATIAVHTGPYPLGAGLIKRYIS